MKKSLAVALTSSIAVVFLLGWMLATPVSKINLLHTVHVADGVPPNPPPPWAGTAVTLANAAKPPLAYFTA